MFARTLLLSGVASAALSACAGGAFNGPEHGMSIAERHPIAVDSQTVTLTLNAASLSETDSARLAAFADAYHANGHGPITITSPSGGAEGAPEIREALNDAGIDYSQMNGATYQAGDEIVVSFKRYVATPSPCGIWTGVKGRNFRNIASPNYGCATQNNLAAMVADPRDLIEPAASDPRDAAAVVRGIEAFREGASTSSAEEDIDVGLAN